MAERGTETRERLVETALRLFRTEGFHATTMRRIASEAGVSLGNAYYYFDSKDDLVHELYLSVQREHRSRALPLLREGAPLAANLRVVLHTGLDAMDGYHDFGSAFVQIALPTSSRTSPFSQESSEARDLATSLLAHAVLLSQGRPPQALADRLPMLLWFSYLGVTLHWVTDSSPRQVRTRREIVGRGQERDPFVDGDEGGRGVASDELRACSNRAAEPLQGDPGRDRTGGFGEGSIRPPAVAPVGCQRSFDIGRHPQGQAVDLVGPCRRQVAVGFVPSPEPEA